MREERRDGKEKGSYDQTCFRHPHVPAPDMMDERNIKAEGRARRMRGWKGEKQSGCG